MKKEQLLQQLHHQTLIHLKPSNIHGIGVFALVDITKGREDIFSTDKSEWLYLTTKEVDELPAHSKALIENFCLYDAAGYFVPEYGFTIIDLSVYLNHSDMPNIASINDGEKFIALRHIKAGEELLIDYGTIVSA